MNKRLCRIAISMITTSIMIVASITFAYGTIYEDTNGGKYKTEDPRKQTNLCWTLDSETGLLIISGEGEMRDTSSGSGAYWCGSWNGKDLGPLIVNVVVEEGVTSIGNYAFASGPFKPASNLKSMIIPSTVTRIGECVFYGANPKSVVIYSRNATFGVSAINSDATIYGYAGSTAEAYAKANNINFVAMCDVHTPKTVDEVKATCTTSGYSGDEICDVCGARISNGVIVEMLGHDYVLTNKKEVTCNADGYSGDMICSRCGDVESRGHVIATEGHSWGNWENLSAPSCTSGGEKIRYCNKCDEFERKTVEAPGHAMTVVEANEATCTSDGNITYYSCSRCSRYYEDEAGTKSIAKDSWITKALGHDFESNWTVDKDATVTETGIKSHHCTRCGERTDITTIPKTSSIDDITRVYDSNRYGTSIKLADTLKKITGDNPFDNIVVACGSNYPDALAGGYLAKVKNAPLITVDTTIASEANVKSYIDKNMKPDGTVYILGGTGVVTARFEDSLKKAGYKVERLAGAGRFETNLAILEEAGANEDILVCDAYGYADSLSASAAGRPILLVGDTLSAKQIEYLKKQSIKNFYLIGGEGAVKASIAKQMDSTFSGNVERLAGASRFETSTKVAEKFFPTTEAVVLAYGQNFPDGLSGGPVALSLDAPLILATSESTSFAKAYFKKAGASKVLTIGGPGLISDKAVKVITN